MLTINEIFKDINLTELLNQPLTDEDLKLMEQTESKVPEVIYLPYERSRDSRTE
jgi:hypothetical protein